MPSPFPGMDPILESPEYFEGFHNDLVFCLQEQIQPILPEPYFAKSGRRVWIELSSRGVVPDVNVLRPNMPRRERDDGGGVATSPLAETLAIDVELIESDEFRETYLEIYTLRDEEKRLVTAVEVLSPANKGGNAEVRGKYVQKQRELLASEVNLIEIDLLRAGRHTTAVPQDLLKERAGPFDYHVCLRLFSQPKRFYVYPCQLADRLPRIALPLLPGDPMPVLDLQAAFDRAYDSGPYYREIDYRVERPEPALTPEQQAWVGRTLEAAGR